MSRTLSKPRGIEILCSRKVSAALVLDIQFFVPGTPFYHWCFYYNYLEAVAQHFPYVHWFLVPVFDSSHGRRRELCFEYYDRWHARRGLTNSPPTLRKGDWMQHVTYFGTCNTGRHIPGPTVRRRADYALIIVRWRWFSFQGKREERNIKREWTDAST